ncbi:hypothetical protein NPIL_123921 [Nephila pilipes]|uniref:Uncharacterized protein n=1 Tax=Nephila pilipes TaxID=299642 RepID=A0A8X6TR61_NEPPI|nr:hypothetical protein NPIL_123921 [Nephila pilipes]
MHKLWLKPHQLLEMLLKISDNKISEKPVLPKIENRNFNSERSVPPNISYASIVSNPISHLMAILESLIPSNIYDLSESSHPKST